MLIGISKSQGYQTEVYPSKNRSNCCKHCLDCIRKGIDPGDDFVVVERYTHVCHHFRKADEDEDTHRSDGPTRPPVGWLSVGRLVRHAPIAVIKDDISTNSSPRYEPRPSDNWDLGRNQSDGVTG
ncbi:unnamed protein product [Nippostrongylus brasiliensis]|uniref:LIM zinc-binding domain-containing protein n=1 Tax=Nippostrongylus brasiliensis TaxID=27835 RepID=A0A0N4Y261_NIPBR|nr:unnamed protein product [Nippostrongylus brasiliensis]